LVDAAHIQANAAAESVKAAKDANNLAKESARTSAETAQQAFIASQRAWLGPNGAKLDQGPVAGKRLGVVITYHNTGREPARNVAWVIDRVIATPEEEANRSLIPMKIVPLLHTCLNLKEREAGQVIYPSTGFAHASLFYTFPEDMIDEDVIIGKKFLIIQGCFVYRTFDKVRHSAFCFYYRSGINKPESLNVCLGGNYTD
jgi:hypothetical protein